METIKDVVLSLCMVCFIGGVFKMLAPSGGLQRVASMVIGVFTLVCFLIPFEAEWRVDSLFSFSLEELTPSALLLEQYEPFLEQSAVEEVVSTVNKVAKEKQIEVTTTCVKTKRQETKVYIERVELSVNGTKAQAEEIRENVLKVMNCEVSITWTKES